MNNAIRLGWHMTWRHKYVLVILFLYRLLWGFFLYRFVDKIVSPILARYPDAHPLGEGALHLFLIEAQFRLMKTSLADDTLWMLAGLLFIRMLLTPFLNAGIYYSLQHTDTEEGTQVWRGIRTAWKPVTLLYALENGLALLPAAWLIPMGRAAFRNNPDLTGWLHQIWPYAAGWGVWFLLVHLLFVFMQFSAVSGQSPWNGILLALRKMVPLGAATLLLFAALLLASAAMTASTWIWTGLIAITLQQSFQFIRTFFTFWTAAAQHQVWKSGQTV